MIRTMLLFIVFKQFYSVRTETVQSEEVWKENKMILNGMIDQQQADIYPLAMRFIKGQFFMLLSTVHLYRAPKKTIIRALDRLQITLYPHLLISLKNKTEFYKDICNRQADCNVSQNHAILFQIKDPRTIHYVGVIIGKPSNDIEHREMNVYRLDGFEYVSKLQIKYPKQHLTHVYIDRDDGTFMSFLVACSNKGEIYVRLKPLKEESSIEFYIPQNQTCKPLDKKSSIVLPLFAVSNVPQQLAMFILHKKKFIYSEFNMGGDKTAVDSDGRNLVEQTERTLMDNGQATQGYYGTLKAMSIGGNIRDVFTVSNKTANIPIPTDTIDDVDPTEKPKPSWIYEIIIVILIILNIISFCFACKAIKRRRRRRCMKAQSTLAKETFEKIDSTTTPQENVPLKNKLLKRNKAAL